MPKQLLSLIIPISRKADPNDFQELIRSISLQKNVNMEVLVVKESPEFSMVLNCNIPIRILTNTEGASRARNIAASQADGDYFAFLDDDIVLDPSWGEKLVSTFSDLSIGAVSGFALPAIQGVKIDWIPRELMWVIGGGYWDSQEIIDVLGGAGMNFCVRRDTFFEAGEYNEMLGPINDRPESGNWRRLGAEESELAIRIVAQTRKRVVFNPEMLVIHRLRRSSLLPKALFKRALHVGHNRAYLRSIYSVSLSSSSDKIVLSNLPKRFFSRSIFSRPFQFWKTFSFTAIILIGTFVGYVLGTAEFRKTNTAKKLTKRIIS